MVAKSADMASRLKDPSINYNTIIPFSIDLNAGSVYRLALPEVQNFAIAPKDGLVLASFFGANNIDSFMPSLNSKIMSLNATIQNYSGSPSIGLGIVDMVNGQFPTDPASRVLLSAEATITALGVKLGTFFTGALTDRATKVVGTSAFTISSTFNYSPGDLLTELLLQSGAPTFDSETQQLALILYNNSATNALSFDKLVISGTSSQFLSSSANTPNNLVIGFNQCISGGAKYNRLKLTP